MSTAIVWDIIILILTISGMRRQGLPRNTPLSSTLITHGLWYVVVACVTGIPMTVSATTPITDLMCTKSALLGCGGAGPEQ